MKRNRLRISFNSPVVLSFVLACAAVRVLSVLTGGAADRALFSVYRSSLLDPLTYVRFIGHVFGHASWDHLMGNMMYLLILGPMLEEKYGSENILFIMGAAAVVTGLCSVVFFPYVRLMGASGIVFAFILLASITSVEDGAIPASFVLVAVIYIGQQVYQGLFVQDSVSQMAHIIGGIVGSVLGFALNSGRKAH